MFPLNEHLILIEVQVGSKHWAGRSPTNNLLTFQNINVCSSATFTSPESIDKIKLRTHPLCGLNWHA